MKAENADLLSRLEKAEQQLKEAEWLLQNLPMHYFHSSQTIFEHKDRRDAWLKQRKESQKNTFKGI